MQGLVKKILARQGFILRRKKIYSSIEYQVFKISKIHKTQLIIDGGSAKGDFAFGLINEGYNGRIVCVEPIKKTHEILKERFKLFNNISVFRKCALSNKNQITNMYIAKNPDSSSMFKPTIMHAKSEKSVILSSKEKVETITIEKLLLEIPDIKLCCKFGIKLDLQGMEYKVLSAISKKLWKNITFVALEASIFKTYHGAKAYLEIINFMLSKNFSLCGIHPGHSFESKGILLQADFVFIKNSNKTNI